MTNQHLMHYQCYLSTRDVFTNTETRENNGTNFATRLGSHIACKWASGTFYVCTVMSSNTTEHVALRSFLVSLFWYPRIFVKSLQLIWWSGIRRFIYGYPITKWFAMTWEKLRGQYISPCNLAINSRYGDMHYLSMTRPNMWCSINVFLYGNISYAFYIRSHRPPFE